MGYIKHDAIVVTAGEKEQITAARKLALKLELEITDTVCTRSNGYYSFLIVPDGSKEGWEVSNEKNAARAKWIAAARNCRSLPWDHKDHFRVDWIAVRFGGDDEMGYATDHCDAEVKP